MLRALLLIMLCAIVKADAQFIFTNIQPKNGLPSKAVSSIYQDDEGFIWIGTGKGLSRYDGSMVRTYNRANGNFAGFMDEGISSITGYKRGKIWIGVERGLACFDKITNTFATIPFVDASNKVLVSPYVVKLIAYGENLWVATDHGLFIIQDNKAVPVSKVFQKASVLDDLFCIGNACLLDVSRKGLWIGSRSGLYFLNYATSEVLSPENNPQHAGVFLPDSINSIAKDAQNNLWLSTSRRPLTYYDFAKNTFSDVHYYDAAHKWKINSYIPAMFMDSYSRLWISSEYTRIFVLQPNNKFSRLPDQSPPGYKLAYGSFFFAFEDAQNNIFIGTPNGLFKLSASNPLLNIVTFPGHLPQPFVEDLNINSLFKYKDHQWWVCKDDGLYLYNEETGSTERFVLQDPVLPHLRVFGVVEVNGEWWCATRDGIHILNLATQKFRPFTYYAKGHEVRNRSAYWVYKDSRGYVWFAAWADAIYRFDPVTKETIRFDGSDKQYGDIGLTNSLCAMEASDGKVWVSFGGNGIRYFDYNTNRFVNPAKQNKQYNFDSIRITCFIEDKQHNIIMSTMERGILKLDKKGVVTNFLTTENGLPSNSTNCIFIDKNNVAWTVIDGIIYNLKPGSKNVSVIKVNINLPLQDAWSSIESAEDKLYVTIVNKLITIDLAKVNVVLPETPTLLSRISVFEKDILFSSLKPSLDLSYDQNFFTIEFSSPVDNEHSSVQYAYKLDRFDKDWVYCGSRQIASYTNVPNGHYTFLVKSTKENGEWSTKVSEIKIFVEAPFWKKWWFISLIVLAFAMLAWWLLKRRIQYKQKKKIDRTIDYFANSIYGENSINEICWDIARNCISQLELEECVVYLADDERKVLVEKAAFGPQNPKGQEIAEPFEINWDEGIVGTVAATRKPLLINNTAIDSRYLMNKYLRLSELAVPIVHEGEVIGVIDSEHSKKNYFTAGHLKALTTIASISSNKIAEAKAEAIANANELQLLEINKLLAESQLMALRTQMNPHFVFNCLNSIQECIVTEKYPQAITYLNKFSKLFRSILNNSSKVYVSLQEEIEVLDLYLELELMRFEKSFSYQIIVDEELDEDIELPSMLLQPYVENALWHGLMHKDGDKKLTIEFKSIDEDTFQCIIDDNGIGRKKSFKLKEHQSKAKHHQSKGMRITKDRIDLLKRQGNHATLEIIDKEENGIATGTRVIIELSAFLK